MSGKKVDYLLFALVSTFWGGSFVAIKFIVLAFPPIFGAMLRVGTSLLILLAIFLASGSRLRAPLRLRWKMWVAGLFSQGLPFCLLFWGECRISPGLAGIINGTVPLWTMVLGLCTGLEEASFKKSLCLALGFCGIACIFLPIASFGGGRDEILRTCAVFLMAVSYAIGALLNRYLLAGRAQADQRANLFHQHCASLAFLVAAAAAFEPWPGSQRLFSAPAAWVAVLYLGLFSTALAFLIFYHLIREWGAVRASAATYVAPVISLFWDFVFFRNVPNLYDMIGMAAILASVVLLHAAHRPSPALAAKTPAS